MAPWIAALAAFALLVSALTLWLRVTPESSISGFDLQPGERQLWIGAPAQGLMLPRGIYWQTAALLQLTLAGIGVVFASFDRDFFRVFVGVGALFVFVALCLLFVPHFTDAQRRKLITYALTDQRAVVSIGREMQWYPLESLQAGFDPVDHHPDGIAGLVSVARSARRS